MEDVRTWRGRDVVDGDGDKIGTLEDIYLDRQTGEPEWAAIRTGLFGTKVSFAPLRDAAATGEQIRIAYAKSQVKDAPSIDADGELSPQEEQRLYQHYGRGDYGEWDRETDRTEAFLGRDERFGSERGGELGDATTGRGPVGHDTSGPTTDDAMTRSEEELRVGKSQRETGRARLRKYVVTENVQQTVPVQREEVRVEREPITDANVGQAMDGPEISEEEHEVTLHAEEPVVEKRAVPKERVRLEKDAVTDARTVDEEVRKERIEGQEDAEGRL
ncbi:MAG TPA: PRC and DUF2382 domain-containing protein [Solirubrobacteraceae bacterium]|nr:PRC and DUF2382 domain-containing protein [Solirubrobacteraceae bacterium]